MRLKKNIDKKTALKVVAGFFVVAAAGGTYLQFSGSGSQNTGYPDEAQPVSLSDVTPVPVQQAQPPVVLQPGAGLVAQDASAGAGNVATTALAGQSGIQPTSPAKIVVPNSIGEQLSKEAELGREIRLLRLQAEQKKLMDEINGVTPGSNGLPGQHGNQGLPPPAVAVADSESFSYGSNYRVTSIYGDIGNLRAEIESGGMKLVAKRGDRLNDGWVVSSITANAVILKNKKDTLEMRLGG